MVVGEICCVQTSCTILLGLHSICYNVTYGQTQRYSVNCLWFRHATTSSLGVRNCFSHFMERPVSCLPYNYSLVQKQETCQITVNLNSLKINHDHFPSMSSSNCRLSSGFWVIEQHAIMVSATIRSSTVCIGQSWGDSSVTVTRDCGTRQKLDANRQTRGQNISSR